MNGNRIIYIDQVKVFLTCMVVAHHAAQAYGPTGGMWVVHDDANTDWLRQFFFVNASYMMGLYFFISGYFMVFSIKKKPTVDFLKDRFKRLGIPLLFFTLFVFLPFNYYFSATEEGVFGFLLDTYFNMPPIATGHLWFLASLLVYSIIYILFFHGKFLQWSKNSGLLRFWHILIFTLLISVLGALIRLKFPIDTWKTWLIPLEPAHLPQYFMLFLAGAYFNHVRWLDQVQDRVGIFFFSLAVLSFALQGQLPEGVSNYWITEALLESMMCIGLSLGIITVFKKFGNRPNPVFSKLSENSYGIYLVHLFLVILLQYSLLNFPANANVKFVLVTVAGIFLSFLLAFVMRSNKYIKQII